jgi:NADP-dependent 3-hydroxy acid dehydrogenase YdfG
VHTVDPGLVQTNFSRVRFRGDEERAKAVYAGVEPLRPEDVAACILFVVTRPPHVNVDELVVKALAQSSAVRIARTEEQGA